MQIVSLSQTPVTHAYKPSYSEGRDQEDYNLKPVLADSSWDLILKIPNTKKWAGGVAQVIEYLPNTREALSLNPSTAKK
jgi:hypothetical protein